MITNIFSIGVHILYFSHELLFEIDPSNPMSNMNHVNAAYVAINLLNFMAYHPRQK